jgi:hypothetical protein
MTANACRRADRKTADNPDSELMPGPYVKICKRPSPAGTGRTARDAIDDDVGIVARRTGSSTR